MIRNGDLSFFFFNDTATTEIYTLSLHDALPIYVDAHSYPCRRADARRRRRHLLFRSAAARWRQCRRLLPLEDRKSTRLNSSHANISYAVFCLKKKKTSISHLLTYN